MENFRVIIAEDNRIYAEGLRRTLEEELPVQFCGVAANGKEAVELVAAVKPDLVIMDVQMPVMNGIEATRQILEQQPGVKVLGLTMYSHEFLIVDMMEAGAMGYVDKLASEDYLAEAVRTVQKGLTYFCPTTNTRLARLLVASKAKLVLTPVDFTEEELRLIRLLCEEHTTKAIAAILKVSESTVDRMRRRLQEKMGAKTAGGVILHASRMGLI